MGITTPPRWNAGPSQGYSPAFYLTSLTIGLYLFILLGRERHCENKVVCQRTQQNDQARPVLGLKPRPLQPESSALTIMLQHNGIFHEYKRKGEVEMQYSLSIHAIEIMISFSPSVIWSCMQTLAFKCCHEKKWKNMMSSSTTIGINQCQFHVLFFFFFFFFFNHQRLYSSLKDFCCMLAL